MVIKSYRDTIQFIKGNQAKVQQAKDIYDQIDKHKLQTAHDMQWLINGVGLLLRDNKKYRDYILNPVDEPEIDFEDDRKNENKIFKEFEEIKNRYGDVQL